MASKASVNPYIMSSNAAKHMDWMKRVFDADVIGDVNYFKDGSNRVMHACLQICNGGKIMINDHCTGNDEEGQENKSKTDGDGGEGSSSSTANEGRRGGETYRGIAIAINYEENAKGDGAKYWKRGISNGAKVICDFQLQFWGAWFGSFLDPYGVEWMLHEEVNDSDQHQKEASQMKNGDTETK
eukprot:gene11128-12299_t